MERPHRHDMAWRELCQQTAKEHDPERLIELVQRLNEALEERQRRCAASPSNLAVIR